jgi:hypothetical protein
MFLPKPFSDKFMSTEPKPAYSPGLAGVIAGETEICWVDPNAGLMYRGYDIHEMASKASFEEVAYLLLNGELRLVVSWLISLISFPLNGLCQRPSSK